MEPVGILARVDTRDDGVFVEALGQRQLHQVAGAGRVRVEPVDRGLEFALAAWSPAARPGSTRSPPRRSRGACPRRRPGCLDRRRPGWCRARGRSLSPRRAATRTVMSALISAAVALPSRITAVTTRQSFTAARTSCRGRAAASTVRRSRDDRVRTREARVAVMKIVVRNHPAQRPASANTTIFTAHGRFRRPARGLTTIFTAADDGIVRPRWTDHVRVSRRSCGGTSAGSWRPGFAQPGWSGPDGGGRLAPCPVFARVLRGTSRARHRWVRRDPQPGLVSGGSAGWSGELIVTDSSVDADAKTVPGCHVNGRSAEYPSGTS